MSLQLRSMASDERGSVAIIFAISLVVLTLSIGLAVDYSRAVAYYDRTQAALDSAVLAVSKAAANGADQARLDEVGKSFFNEAMKGSDGITFGKLSIKVDAQSNEVQAQISGRVRTMVGKIIGLDGIRKDVASVATSSAKNIELGMMLDVSGSMKGHKIVALKDASNALVDILFSGSENSRKARIGIAPFSTSVNLGKYALAAKGNGKAGGGRDNDDDDDDDDKKGKGGTCVSERKGAHAFTDASPKGGNLLGNKASKCPDPVVMPLSDDKDVVKDSIESLEADGATAGHLGIAWAWYLVSEKWRDFWPADRAPEENDAKLLKAVVLMTDGEFNTEYEKDSNGKSAAQAAKLCQNMKAEGVMIFTVAFDAPKEVLPLFAECASIPSYAFDPKDAAGLKKSFRRIAQYLNDLRVAR